MNLLLPVGCWTEKLIVAKVPTSNPRPGQKVKDERFSIWFESGDSKWSTDDDIWIMGSEGNWPDPPTHSPEASESLSNR